MQCKHAQELLSDYIAGSVAPALTVSLENHMAECAGCRHDLAGIRVVWEQMEAIPSVDPPMYFHENIMSRLDKQMAEDENTANARSTKFDWKSLFRTRSLAFAAVVLIIMLSGAGVMRTTHAGLGFPSLFSNHNNDIDLELKKSTQAHIMFNTTGGAKMEVHMQAVPLAHNVPVNMHYSLNIKGSNTIIDQGIVSSDKEIVVPIQLTQVPERTFTLEATLSYSDAENHTSTHKVIIPVISAPFGPDSINSVAPVHTNLTAEKS